mgnify:CR=1 FL=1
MSENGMGISRRGFVAGAGATALGVGLAGGIVGCAPGTEKESEHTAGVEKTAYDPKAGEWIPTTCNMCFNNCSIKAHVIDGVVVERDGQSRQFHRPRAYMRQGARRASCNSTIPTASPSL